MEILPPRRPGQLGAIKAGAGSQGPSGGFSIDSSSRAKRSDAPSPRAPPPAKGSVAKPTTQSVSEQVAMQQSTSATVARAAVKDSTGGTYSPGQKVAVRSYVPPPSTPAITQPPKQPNESAQVKILANQIPQTQAQAIQKVLASDAGIAMPLPAGQPPTVLPTPARVPGVVGSLEKDEEILFLAIARAVGSPAPESIRAWAAMRRKKAPAQDMRAQIGTVVSMAYQGRSPMAANARAKVAREMESWLAIVEQKDQPIQPVNATTSSSMPVPRPPPATSPVLNPEVAKRAALASGAIVGAKVAEQKAIQVATVTDLTKVRTQTTAEAKKRADADAAYRRKQAEARAKALADAKQNASVVLADQTASEDAKAKAQAELRDAQEAAALAKKQSAEAEAQAQKLAAEKAKLEADVMALEEAKAKAQAEAQAKAEEATKKQEAAVQAEASASQPGIVIPFPGSVSPVPQPVPVQAEPAPPQPSAGISPLTVGLGLAVVAALVYARTVKSTMNGAPLVVELEENEE